MLDIELSLESLANNEHAGAMLKMPQDLERYKRIIEATKPEVLVETGTLMGASSRWFAGQGLEVVTVDINHRPLISPPAPGVTMLKGDAADPEMAAKVAGLVAGRRCMVSLDSDHSGPHVTQEIRLYSPLVTPGCYLVVEDGIFGLAPPELRARHGLGNMIGSPLDAIAELLEDNPDWSHDDDLANAYPVTHHPRGWWRKRVAS